MNSFAIDQTNSTIVATPMIWIFILSSVVFTAITFLVYYWMSRRDTTTLLENLASEWDIQAITERFTFRNRRNSDLQVSEAYRLT